MQKPALLALALLAGLSLSACGRHEKVTTTVNTTTIGQELTDLQTAYEDGAITEEEHEAKRQEILNRKE